MKITDHLCWRAFLIGFAVVLLGAGPVPKVATGQDTEDARIAEAVQRELAANPFVDMTNIKVTVVGGIAYLSGKAHTSFESYQAEYTASGVKGVLDVVNRIEVSKALSGSYEPAAGGENLPLKPDPDREGVVPGTALSQDNQIRQRIVDALEQDLLLDPDEIQVSVEGGIATLTGSVDSPHESNAAERSAFEAGATGVVNNLRLK